MSEIYHEIVFFSGRVQGVGFRYSTLQVAKEFDVAGSVSNLADGRVQLEVEGQTKAVNDFVAALENKMHGYIRKIERRGGMRAPQLTGFTIR